MPSSLKSSEINQLGVVLELSHRSPHDEIVALGYQCRMPRYTACMFILPVALALLIGQQAAENSTPERPVLKAGLGACSAEFTVRGAAGEPVFGATIHVRVRYGMLGMKRSDLEIGTDSNGRARIEGLPAKAKPLAYEIQKDGKKATAEQVVADMCEATYEVTLK